MSNQLFEFSSGQFAAITGLSDKALRLYGERGILTPVAVDPVNGYRSYSLEQVREGVTLDLLRRANIGLDDLTSARREQFEEHRARKMMRRAMEDFYLDLAEHVRSGDLHALNVDVQSAPAAHWIAVDIPFTMPSDAEGMQASLTTAAVDLPALDRSFATVLRAHGIDLLEESWTTSSEDAEPRMRLAHRIPHPVPEAVRKRVESSLKSAGPTEATIAAGSLPERQELVYSRQATEDPGGTEHIADTALSYLAVIAFAHHLAEHGGRALSDTARRRVHSASLFDSEAPSEDVFDLIK